MPSTSRRDDFLKRGLHRIIAREIRQGSDVLERARLKVSEWEEKAPQPVPLYVSAWKEILSRPDNEVARLITAPTEEMDRWRCSTPFMSHKMMEKDVRLRFSRKMRKLAPL